MNTKSKALLLLLCAVLLAAGSVFGTLAYLTDYEAAANTFTVGSVGLKLNETDVKPDGTQESENRVQANEYHLLPGRTYIKDPTVTVDKGSSEAYIRMIVKVVRVDQLKAALPQKDASGAVMEENKQYYEDLNNDGTADFVLEKLLNNTWDYNDWHFAGYSESDSTGIYEFRYHTTVDASKATEDVPLSPLFTAIMVPGEIDNTHLAYLEDVQILVNAHAIQAAGFEGSEDGAWAAFDAQHTCPL